MSSLFHQILIEPLVIALVFLYNNIAFQDFGVAIILLTVVVRIILHPLFYKGLKHQAALRALQPHLDRIQKDHQHDREAQGRAMLALYKEHRVNPFSGFLLLLIQLPILIALYRVFLNPPPGLNYSLFNLINLQERSMIIVGIAVVAQYILGHMSIVSAAGGVGSDGAAGAARTMVLFSPLLTAIILFSLPSAVGVYWITTTLFSIAQQAYVNATYTTNITKTSGDGRSERTGD